MERESVAVGSPWQTPCLGRKGALLYILIIHLSQCVYNTRITICKSFMEKNYSCLTEKDGHNKKKTWINLQNSLHYIARSFDNCLELRIELWSTPNLVKYIHLVAGSIPAKSSPDPVSRRIIRSSEACTGGGKQGLSTAQKSQTKRTSRHARINILKIQDTFIF